MNQPYNCIPATLALEHVQKSTESQRNHSLLLQKEILNEVPSLIYLEFLFLQK